MTILATIVVLGVLIFVHELGHFLAAKAVGVEVQRFSIGLGPTLFGFQHGETEYVLSAIPLGGYVKMGGMDDEVMERMEGGPAGAPRQPSPRDFDSKPLWARTFVISAGVIMNMLFAFGAYTASAAVWGFRELDTTRVGEVVAEALPAGAEPLAEIQPGQRVLRVGDRDVEHWGDIRDGIMEAPTGPLTVALADPEGSVEFRVPSAEEDRRRILIQGIRDWVEPVVGMVNPGSPAERGGLEADDRILAVDGEPVTTWWDFVRAVESRPGEEAELRIDRGGQEIIRIVTPEASTEADPLTGQEVTVGKVGVYQPADPIIHLPAGISEAVVFGARETVAVTAMILDFLRDLVTGQVSPRSMGSIVTIGEASGQAASMGVEPFLRFMALFSINLAVLNLLPIPILDGGHLLFLGIEAIRGKALSVEQRLRWSNVGFLIVMGIMIWALSNDMLRLFGL